MVQPLLGSGNLLFLAE